MTTSAPDRYVLITPCRDEAEFARETLESVTRQSVPPALWVIVDDGSTDGTDAILAEYARRFPYIRVLTRADRGARSVGPGVIDAFYAGYATIDPNAFDFVCKLDLDLALPPDYFRELIRRMWLDPRMGTCSGKPFFRAKNGTLVSEGCGDEMSVGMTKFYRVECFEEIGGFVREVMWDGIDCHRCRMLGWKAESFHDPKLRFVHLRPMGSSHKGILTGRMRHGYGQWFMGTGPAYMAASAVYRTLQPPYVIGGLGMAVGYLASCLRRAPRYGDVEFRRFLRDYQRDCLWYGKERATRACEARRAAMWKPDVVSRKRAGEEYPRRAG